MIALGRLPWVCCLAATGAFVACSSTPSDEVTDSSSTNAIGSALLDFDEERNGQFDDVSGCIPVMRDFRLVVAHDGFQRAQEYDLETWPTDLVITDIEVSSASGAELEKMVILGSSALIGSAASLDELIDEGYETASLPFAASSPTFVPAVASDVSAAGPANPPGPLVEMTAMVYTFVGNTYRAETPLSLYITRRDQDDPEYCAEFPE